MLTRIECDGFRSLSSFHLDIHPGVNLLLGPNGSGKTNIINLLDFVGKTVDSTLSDAVGAMGGAGAIFRKQGDTQHEDKVSVTLYGYTKASTRSYFKYKFDIQFQLSPDRDTVIYTSQSLLIDKCSKKQVSSRAMSGDINISVKPKDGKLKIDCSVDKKIETPYPKKDFERYISAVLEPEDSLMAVTSRITPNLWRIRWDVGGGLSLNVIPSKAKQPEDSTTAPRIQPDGSGLYATLRAAIKADGQLISPNRKLRFRAPLHRQYDSELNKDTYTKILAAAQFANQSINAIKVVNDAFDNKLKGSIVLASDGEETELPIASMSDGTIKWLVLITAIYSGSKMLSIEEPENYLHPLVQMEIINIFRDQYKDEKFVLVSSHSETLLNAAKPQEVVLVEFRNGKTIASRVSNAKELRREIKRTGFGLGFYYVSGALEGENA